MVCVCGHSTCGQLVVDLLGMPGGSEADDIDEVSDSRAETLPLCSRLQTADQTSSLHQPIPVADLWTYLSHQKTVGYHDVKAEYEVCLCVPFLYCKG